MIKVLLVDDDVEMLQGLSNIIRWEDHGFTIAGTAVNGLEALNMISEIMPDIVVTDITMPSMDGLELIREAKKFKHGLKSVIISCHEDFEYAREAIRLEADEYILKHTLTCEELLRVLTAVKEKIEYERRQLDSIYKTNRELYMNRDVILEKFFSELMNNDTALKPEISDRAALNGIVLPEGSFRLISAFVDDIDKVLRQGPVNDYGSLRAGVLNIIEETSKGLENKNVFPYRKNAFGLLYWDNTKEVPLKQKIIAMLGDIQKNMRDVLGFRLSFCISSVYDNMQELKKAAQEVEALRDSYFFKGPGEIITKRTVFSFSEPKDLYEKFGPEIKGLLSRHKRRETRELLDSLFERLSAGEYSPNCVRLLFRHLISDMESISGRYGMDLEEYQIRCDTFAASRKTLLDAIDYVFDRLDEPLNKVTRPEIRKVIEYMDAHLSEEISCDNMAGYVNMNSSYFSRLFKNEVGLSFSDYLLNRRMETATKLLGNSDYSIEQIVKAVGIESISYFYRAYKKITGKTPGDVRNKAHPRY